MSSPQDLEREAASPRVENVDQVEAKSSLPWKQLSIIFFLQISEPLTSQLILPFAPQMIMDIGVTGGDEARVGYYVGLLNSLFFATEALTIFHWSRISDYLGRKPVVLTGLFGLSISMFCFGLSKNFTQLVLSRCLTGALNGNCGVMKSVMAEITDTTNMPQVIGLTTFAWAAGTTIGPLIGGILEEPAMRFPGTFGKSEFFQTYPYFLPCAVAATFSALSFVMGFFFFKETVQTPLTLRDIKERLKLRRSDTDLPLRTDLTVQNVIAAPDVSEKPLSLRKLLTPRVLISAGTYATVSLVEIAIRTVQPVFYATSVPLGGLNLSPLAIGNILAIAGAVNGLFQVFLFAPVHNWMGTKNLLIAGVLSGFPAIAIFPVANLLAKQQGMSTSVWVLVALQQFLLIIVDYSYGATFMYVNSASPNRASIGATNGLAQMTVSTMRAVGPIVSDAAFSLSVGQHILGGQLVYCILAGMVFLALGISSMLPRKI
ncbi:major facilitator superfamily domain-containing protein [Hygrophoropsis aurantiaca]|uniref:Major facilitator superfamily domain-containing protein n=1 Tax=Hygrophoropsis aurantiaca TaxID=72124 RepID=A0ACB8AM49_9AGAM|nr:major facilitator superfamily domain-containing protein [Hygrophoropsis aurantiaca]